MNTQKPWAYGNLIIGSEWQGQKGDIFSVLRGGRGLPQVESLMAERYGRYPVVGGVRRRARRLTVETYFTKATTRDAYRLLALQTLSPESEDPFRFTIVDNVLPGIGPEDVLVAFGPWDLYYDGSNWRVRGILEQATATLAGAWSIAPGEGLDLDGGSDACTVTSTDLSGANAIEVIWKPTEASTYGTNRYLFDGGSIELYFRASDDKFVLTDGTTTIASAAQTFAAESLQHIVARFSVAGAGEMKLVVNGTETTGLGTVTAFGATCYIGSEATPSKWVRGELVAFRCYDDLTSTQMGYLYEAFNTASDDPIGNARHVDAIAEAVDPLVLGGKRTMDLVSTLGIDGDVRWRSRDGDYWHWDVTGTGDQETVTVDTEDEVYPVLYLEQTGNRTSGLLYKRWVPIVWKADAAGNYPTKLGTLDTATLISGGKMQADGDDLRVYNGQTEIDRWIQDINTGTTDIWVVLDFKGAASGSLSANIGSGDTITSLTSTTDISGFPSSGIILINSEAFTYRGKNDASKTFNNVVRAAKGTSAAAHTAADTMYWIQHDLWILYDDSTLSAPTTDDDYKPVMELDTSNNDSWVYANFGEDGKPRSGSWVPQLVDNDDGNADTYNGNQGADATPWVEIGVAVVHSGADPAGTSGAARFYVYNVCGITNANFTNGEYYYGYANGYSMEIQSSLDGVTWNNEDDLPAAGTGAWRTWSDSEALDSGAKYVGIYVESELDSARGATVNYKVEAADCTLTLDTTYTPDATINAEQNNYELDATITNNITGDAILLEANINVNDIIEIDTDNKTILNLTEGENLYGILTMVGGTRKEWLALGDGDNELQYDESGVADADIDLVWDRRYFE